MPLVKLFMGVDPGLRRLVRKGIAGHHDEQVEKLRQSCSLPNVIIIGAAKSATTTITDILPRHPDCFVSKPKEPKFFGRYYSKGWDWYGSRFSAGSGKSIRCEGSTMYSSSLPFYKNTPALLHRCIPDAKLIYIVRNPLDRIVSQWRHVKGRQQNIASFDEIMSDKKLKRLIVGCSLYYHQLQRFRQFFPDDQIHCLAFEDLVASPKVTLKTLLSFLQIPTSVGKLLDDGKLPRSNEAGDKGRLFVPPPNWAAHVKDDVLSYLREDSCAILDYLGKPSSFWSY